MTADDLSAGLMELGELMAPMLDAAEGMKADMVRRGWTPQAAEEAALEWYKHMIRLSMAK